jgi:threonyl-tRNA synthetase
MLVAGRREAEQDSFSVRNFAHGDRGAMTFADIEAEIVAKVASREFDVKLKKIAWNHDEADEVTPTGY